MKNIVKIENSELVVSINDIALFSGVAYESTQRLVRKNKSEFAELGLSIPKESDFKSVLFDEYQTSFLITLMKNTGDVKRFKLNLVKQFKLLKNTLCEVNKKQVAKLEYENENLRKGITYKDGTMSLRKIIRENNIKLNETDIWDILVEENIITNEFPKVKKRVLIDKSYGKQIKHKSVVFKEDMIIELLKDYK